MCPVRRSVLASTFIFSLTPTHLPSLRLAGKERGFSWLLRESTCGYKNQQVKDKTNKHENGRMFKFRNYKFPKLFRILNREINKH